MTRILWITLSFRDVRLRLHFKSDILLSMISKGLTLLSWENPAVTVIFNLGCAVLTTATCKWSTAATPGYRSQFLTLVLFKLVLKPFALWKLFAMLDFIQVSSLDWKCIYFRVCVCVFLLLGFTVCFELLLSTVLHNLSLLLYILTWHCEPQSAIVPTIALNLHLSLSCKPAACYMRAITFYLPHQFRKDTSILWTGWIQALKLYG